MKRSYLEITNPDAFDDIREFAGKDDTLFLNTKDYIAYTADVIGINEEEIMSDHRNVKLRGWAKIAASVTAASKVCVCGQCEVDCDEQRK